MRLFELRVGPDRAFAKVENPATEREDALTEDEPAGGGEHGLHATRRAVGILLDLFDTGVDRVQGSDDGLLAGAAEFDLEFRKFHRARPPRGRWARGHGPLIVWTFT